MRRAIWIAIALVVLALAAALFLLARNLDDLVKAAIEHYGSQTTGTPVRVDSVEIRLGEARGTIRGLRVANPDGFDAPNAIALDEIELQLDAASLGEQPLVITSLRVGGHESTFELNAAGQANLRVLQSNLQRRAPAPDAAGDAEAADAPRISIQRLSFEPGLVEARTSAVGGEDVSLELPPLQLANLGGREGAAGGEVGRQILSAYLEQILKTVARAQVEEQAGRAIDEHLEGPARDAARGVLDRLQQ